MIVLFLTLHVTKIFKDFMIVTIIYYILKLLNTDNKVIPQFKFYWRVLMQFIRELFIEDDNYGNCANNIDSHIWKYIILNSLYIDKLKG